MDNDDEVEIIAINSADEENIQILEKLREKCQHVTRMNDELDIIRKTIGNLEESRQSKQNKLEELCAALDSAKLQEATSKMKLEDLLKSVDAQPINQKLREEIENDITNMDTIISNNNLYIKSISQQSFDLELSVHKEKINVNSLITKFSATRFKLEVVLGDLNYDSDFILNTDVNNKVLLHADTLTFWEEIPKLQLTLKEWIRSKKRVLHEESLKRQQELKNCENTLKFYSNELSMLKQQQEVALQNYQSIKDNYESKISVSNKCLSDYTNMVTEMRSNLGSTKEKENEYKKLVENVEQCAAEIKDTIKMNIQKKHELEHAYYKLLDEGIDKKRHLLSQLKECAENIKRA